MSPEQLQGGEETFAVDAFALGCVLYECLCGVPAFVRDDRDATVAATLNGSVELKRLPRGVPVAVRAFLQRLIAPQPSQRPTLDEAAAQASIYGQLIASGWHTACVFMRLFADGLLNRSAAIGSPGLDEPRWLKPVYAGDSLDARVEILEVRPSRSRPDRGAARIRCVVSNQRGDEVLTMIATVMFLRRAVGPTTG